MFIISIVQQNLIDPYRKIMAFPSISENGRNFQIFFGNSALCINRFQRSSISNWTTLALVHIVPNVGSIPTPTAIMLTISGRPRAISIFQSIEISEKIIEIFGIFVLLGHEVVREFSITFAEFTLASAGIAQNFQSLVFLLPLPLVLVSLT